MHDVTKGAVNICADSEKVFVLQCAKGIVLPPLHAICDCPVLHCHNTKRYVSKYSVRLYSYCKVNVRKVFASEFESNASHATDVGRQENS